MRGFTIASRDWKSGTIIEVRVIPRSSRPRVEKMEDGTYRAYLKAAPEKGKANSELKAVIADHLGIPRSDIVIMRGSGSRDKILKVKTWD
jgi:hypothetical protein